ncbi:TetR/AcrR family transcriptional regulator [Corynebacterium flavescens]
MSTQPTPRFRRGRKTGPKPKFSRDDVLAAAISIGLDTFTVASVAKVLGVAPPAIYRLFSSRDELVDVALSTAARSFHVDVEESSWKDLLRSYAREVWRLCEEFPGLSVVIFDYPLAFTHILPKAEQLMARLVSLGLTELQAGFAIDFIGDTVLGTHIPISSMRRVDESGQTGLERIEERLQDLGISPEKDLPLTPDESWMDTGNLDLKLEFILAGLEAGLPKES